MGEKDKSGLYPYKFSGKQYSFDQASEMTKLTNSRDWSIKYLSEHTVITQYYTELRDLREKQCNKPCDLLVKVIKVFEKDEDTLELRIKDTSDELFFMSINKLKFASHQVQ